jgi:hypothetical protein
LWRNLGRASTPSTCRDLTFLPPFGIAGCVRAHLSARDAGDGVRCRRPGLRPVQGRLRARHLRQHEDRSGDDLRRRVSIHTLRPSVHPNCCSRCRNAPTRTCASASFAASGMSTPTRRIRSPCCARALSGHAATAPPARAMKSRRFNRTAPQVNSG